MTSSTRPTLLDAFAERADQHPESYRWSYAREFGPGRPAGGRRLPGGPRARGRRTRSILDDTELAWLDEQMRGDVDHLLVGTSLPVPAVARPALRRGVETRRSPAERGVERGRRIGEKLRQGLDLEHWAAFQDGFQKVARMTLEVARGERGRAPEDRSPSCPATCTTATSREAHPTRRERRGTPPAQSRIIQAVCSPIRNPMPRRLRFLVAVLAYGVAGPIGHVVARSAKVPGCPAEVGPARGPVVRQQPGHPRGHRPRAADVVGHRQGRGRRARPAAAGPRGRRDGRRAEPVDLGSAG